MNLRICLRRNWAMSRGRCVPLTPTEAEVLYVIRREYPRAVPADLVRRRVWGAAPVYSLAAQRYVERVRHKIAPLGYTVVTHFKARFRLVEVGDEAMARGHA